MDFTGVKLLVALVLVILIVFAGSVPTAQRTILDTWYGRLIAAITVLLFARHGGLWLGIMAAVAVLVLLPQSVREGFMSSKSGHVRSNFKNYADEQLSSIKEPFKQVPKERRNPWFIEKIMHEQPEIIETDTVNTQAAQ